MAELPPGHCGECVAVVFFYVVFLVGALVWGADCAVGRLLCGTAQMPVCFKDLLDYVNLVFAVPCRLGLSRSGRSRWWLLVPGWKLVVVFSGVLLLHYIMVLAHVMGFFSVMGKVCM